MSQQTYILLKQLSDHPEQPVDGAPEVEALRQALVEKNSPAAIAAATRCIEGGHLPDGFVRRLLGQHGVEDDLPTDAAAVATAEPTQQQAIAKARRGDILTLAEWEQLPPWLRHRTPHPDSNRPVPTLRQALSFAQAAITGTYVSEAVRLQRQAICARCPYQRTDKAGDPWCSICGCSVGDRRQIRNLAAYEERLPQWGCKHPNRAKGDGWAQLNGAPGAFDLSGFFDLVVVINLRRRPDRFASFTAALAEAAWPFRYPIRFEAVDGAIHRPPPWWRAGNGAWGCRCSQLAVIEQAISDGARSLLILEDDAVFVPDFARKVEAFLRAVPNDWESLYLGGQHLRKPTPVSDGVVLASNINRCHAWAARGDFLKVVRDHWANLNEWQKTPRRHIDHQLGVLHESGRYRVYAPTQWLVGQTASQSNICGKPLAQRFWGKAPNPRPSILAYRAFTRAGQKIGPLASVKAWAEAEGKTFGVFDVPETWSKAGETVRRIRDAERVFIWNGAEPGCAWVKRVCQAHGTPFVIAENGLLPQKGYWHLDPHGIIGDSSLCGPLDWVTDQMLAAADRHIERHFAARRWKYTGDGGYILVPLQLEADTSIYLHSEHKTMQELVDAVRQMYPNSPIVVRPHPVNPDVKIAGQNVTVRSDCSTLELAQHAKHIVGLTSTVLYETAALGAPTTALGRCPLAIHTNAESRRRLLAACVARQIPESCHQLTPYLDALRAHGDSSVA